MASATKKIQKISTTNIAGHTDTPISPEEATNQPENSSIVRKFLQILSPKDPSLSKIGITDIQDSNHLVCIGTLGGVPHISLIKKIIS
tara:strand:+ start:1137 stop:1400 length:264 start_codon:yes stop_codon:yes gene_type:complete